MTNLLTIARLECIGAARLRWIRLLTAAFALLATGAAYAAGSASELTGADGFARTTMTLVPVALILIPLAAVVLGVSGQAVEAGADSFLFGQPVGRATVLIARWAGELAALAAAIAAGFGIGAVIIASSAGTAGLLSFACFVGASVVLAAIFLSIAAAVAASTDKRMTALAVATFMWFVFVLLYDAVALSAATSLTGITGAWGGRVLFVSVFGNPTDLVRIAMLRVAGTSNVLGASGEAWIRFLGGDLRAAVVTGIVLMAWVTAPLAVGVAALQRRDV